MTKVYCDFVNCKNNKKNICINNQIELSNVNSEFKCLELKLIKIEKN